MADVLPKSLGKQSQLWQTLLKDQSNLPAGLLTWHSQKLNFIHEALEALWIAAFALALQSEFSRQKNLRQWQAEKIKSTKDKKNTQN